MAEEQTRLRGEADTAKAQKGKLERLCRTLQDQRSSLKAELKSLKASLERDSKEGGEEVQVAGGKFEGIAGGGAEGNQGAGKSTADEGSA